MERDGTKSVKVLRCVSCNTDREWPGGFPSSIYAQCWKCWADEYMKRPEPKRRWWQRKPPTPIAPVRVLYDGYAYRVSCKDGFCVYETSPTSVERDTESFRRQVARDTARQRDEWCNRAECRRGPHTITRRALVDWEPLRAALGGEQ